MDKSLTQQKPDLTFASSFSKPVHAAYQGESVRITHVGDAQSMSPVFLIIDSQGQSAWVPQSEVRIIDTDYLPSSQDALNTVTAESKGLRTSSMQPAGSSR